MVAFIRFKFINSNRQVMASNLINEMLNEKLLVLELASLVPPVWFCST